MSQGQECCPPWQGNRTATLQRWAAVLFPCALLLQLSYEFSIDWLNNLWLVSHTAAHVRQRGSLPQACNTEELGGMALPVFYGYLLYPTLGAVGAFLGAPAALRLAIFALFALQFVQVRRALRRAGADDRLATGAACLVVWAIYPLTNLYNRGALGEFFATGLLTCALCQWFALLFADSRGERLRAALAVGLCYSLAAGCHPITALYGLVFLVALLPTLLVPSNGVGFWTRCRALVPAGVLTLLVLAPWVFACLRFRKALVINHSYHVYLHSDDLDLWWVRLFPFPLDVRTWTEPSLSAVTAPFLDTQVNLPLFLLAAAVVWGLVRSGSGQSPPRGRWWLGLPVLAAALFLWLSLDSYPYTLLPSEFQAIQFPYRMVSYFNLAVLAALLLAVRVAGRGERTSGGGPSPVLLKMVLALSAAGVFVKLVHAPTAVGQLPRVADATLPYHLYGYLAYAAPFFAPPLSDDEIEHLKTVRLPLGEGRSFGEYQPVAVERDDPGYVALQIQGFPWNRFLVDGRPVPSGDVRLWGGNPPGSPDGWGYPPYSAVPVPAGRHVIEYRFCPEAAWVWLHRVALLVTVLWASALSFSWARAAIRGRAARGVLPL